MRRASRQRSAGRGGGIALADARDRRAFVEVEAAGFVFDGESTAVANPADDHSLNVFDEAIRGKTDQFVYRFRKPN